ncbi:DNA end protector protein [uncultured Caudovirales phage]|uniref:DNA end protector protein n=1 Tax=uncultured Caudovirales phage TaxID=2100421 RepID=A0A6J7WY21_9CAUD|nr:DNA end protector protein [uncultured Caudovirales phage]
MATSPIKDVFDKNKYDLQTAAVKSKAWFEQQVYLLGRQNITPPKVLNGNPDQTVSSIVPGNLYMYMYDPKLKATLPYYDRFPLVFPFSKTEDGFIGLNMHYLPYQLRMVLLDRLLMFRTNKRMDETTRLRYSWAAIDGVSKFAAAQPCVKRYLIGHVRSKFRKINADDWATAMLLPVERFVGASKEAVWQDSKRIIRNA